MSFRTCPAPMALPAAACAAAPAFVQNPDQAVTTVDSIIVAGTRNPDDPSVAAEARARLARTPGAVT